MRYYNIEISQGASSNLLSAINGVAGGIGSGIPIPGQPVPSSLSSLPAWTSLVNGVNDPGALDIEFDVTNVAGKLIGGHLKVSGIAQSVISEAQQFNFCELKLYAGFTTGLPLANLEAPYAGLIADGMILPCFGNWIGTDLSIEFILNPGMSGGGGPNAPKNIIHNMPQGTPLSLAINNALTTAFPGYNISVNIDPSLMLTNQDIGYHKSIEEYSDYIKQLSKKIKDPNGTGNYQGAEIHVLGNNMNVVDGTVVSNVIELRFSDLIGQPTWSPLGNYVMQVKVAMRADIDVANAGGNIQIKLPPNLLVSTPASAGGMFMGGFINQYQHGDILLFQGTWTIIQVRHVGHFRQPTGESWVTIIDAIMGGIASGGGGGVANNVIQAGLQVFDSIAGGI